MAWQTARRGFSLVELLVVIAIISVLAAMLLPSMEQTLARGRLTVCMGNLRQTGAAAQNYAADFKGMVPISCVGGNTFGIISYAWGTTNNVPLGGEFEYFAATYCESKHKYGQSSLSAIGILGCPDKEFKRSQTLLLTGTISYIAGYGMFPAVRTNFPVYPASTTLVEAYRQFYRIGLRLNKVPRPAAIPMFADEAFLHTDPNYPWTTSNHPSLQCLNAVYCDASAASQPWDQQWAAAYFGWPQANYPTWYFPYIRMTPWPR